MTLAASPNVLVALKNNAFKLEMEAYSNYVDIVWIYDGNTWAIGAAHTAFVKWVQDGFVVSCETCLSKHNTVWALAQDYTFSQTVDCKHVEFTGDRKKATKLAKVLSMGLL